MEVSYLKFSLFPSSFSSQQRTSVTAVWAVAAPTRTSSPPTPKGPWTYRTPGTISSSTTRTRTTVVEMDGTMCPTSSSLVSVNLCLWDQLELLCCKLKPCSRNLQRFVQNSQGLVEFALISAISDILSTEQMIQLINQQFNIKMA